MINKSNKKLTLATPFQIFCWCLFDWAHSAFPTVVITFVFGTYFIRSVAESTLKGTAYWGWVMGLSGIVVAILSPVLGSVADYTGRRKPWLGIFTLCNIIFTALLFFVLPAPSWVFKALVILFFANITYEFTQVFYNAMMTSIAPEDKIGRISGWGWGLGYFGGLICLTIALYVFVKEGVFPRSESLNVRLTNLLVAGWFLIFALPLFIYTPDLKKNNISSTRAIKKGCKELWNTLKEIRKIKGVLAFIIAHLFYIDGLSTLFIFAGIYAAGTFNLTYTQILYYAMILNVSAGIGAVIFAWVDDYIGPKFTVSFSLVVMIIGGSAILFVKSVFWFWLLSAVIGLFVGPTQAASRSYMARLSPPHLMNQMFGIYQLSGRITTFIGPILVGVLTELFKSQRAGMSVIFVMMLIGYLILLAVPKPSKRTPL
ncbi:MAG: hypothetical protein S4CHLAM7_13120 [Chlamydiae bacterium]|nr:hypothetical protein [Chlamydiota bacterium]